MSRNRRWVSSSLTGIGHTANPPLPPTQQELVNEFAKKLHGSREWNVLTGQQAYDKIEDFRRSLSGRSELARRQTMVLNSELQARRAIPPGGRLPLGNRGPTVFQQRPFSTRQLYNIPGHIPIRYSNWLITINSNKKPGVDIDQMTTNNFSTAVHWILTSCFQADNLDKIFFVNREKASLSRYGADVPSTLNNYPFGPIYNLSLHFGAPETGDVENRIHEHIILNTVHTTYLQMRYSLYTKKVRNESNIVFADVVDNYRQEWNAQHIYEPSKQIPKLYVNITFLPGGTQLMTAADYIDKSGFQPGVNRRRNTRLPNRIGINQNSTETEMTWNRLQNEVSKARFSLWTEYTPPR